MAPVEYSEITQVEHEEMDKQHRTWIDIFNSLEESMLKCDGSGGDEFQLQLLKQILDFTKVHFADEESLMHKYDYPDVSRHRLMHKNFDQQIYVNYRQVMDGEAVLNSRLLKVLENWFINHIDREDKKAFIHVNAEKAKRDKG